MYQSMCRSHRIGQAKTVHVYRLVSTGTMERMIYEQQIKKVDLSISVVDSHEVGDQTERGSSVAVSDTGSPAKEPFSGFLQPPTEAAYDKELAVEDSMFEGDSVLASCAKQVGRWIADVHRVHEPLDDDKQSA